jgi:RNA polymerase-binding transcription factor DksA
LNPRPHGLERHGSDELVAGLSFDSQRRHLGTNLEVMSKGFRNADETQAASEQATASAISQILERDREQAEHSAQLRAEGKKGVCEDCGGPIGAERMEALPDSTRCVGCQSAWDQTNR